MNMSYCRFHNTRMDLGDCLDALRDEEEVSADEQKYARWMFEEFIEFLFDQGILDDEECSFGTVKSRLEEYYEERGWCDDDEV